MRFHYLVPLSLAAGLAIWLGVGDSGETVAPPMMELAATDQAITPIPDQLALDARKVALGRRLFHDKRLSRDDSVSCATCHRPDRAGADGLPVAVGIQGQRGKLNTPTVFNSGFNFRQFWDGRVPSLEEQVPGPVHNPVEMATDWKHVIAKLKQDPAYPEMFRAIWPDGITEVHIQGAIAEFERGLLTPDAPFDHYLQGKAQALSRDARQGWDLFRNLGCIACHQGVNVGGNMYANLGVMGDFFADRGRPLTDADLGRFKVTSREEDRHVFKVPSLRNVERTAPYFHDGSVPSLNKAVELMARYQLGIHLSDTDTRDLVAFLTSLNGRLPETGK
ncbi:MAG: cytochrome-c peroxidase [Thiobacillus sp.]|nr:cytochrome-c peroxidase [Thiobacillus sp.]